MTDALVLGTTPGNLSVILVQGDPWEASLILKEDGTPVAWPAAPVLEFADLSVAATLGADAATSTADAQATWNMTEDQVATFAGTLTGQRRRVRLSVNGETYWKGTVQCLS